MIISRILIIIYILLAGWNMPNLDSIDQYFQYAQEIAVYQDDDSIIYNIGSPQYTEIINTINELCADSHEMPAFGVSIHSETMEALESGLWLEFRFNQTYTHNDMPFSRLLIEIKADYTGFNIIRYNYGKYDGRCYYINLTHDMSNLYALFV